MCLIYRMKVAAIIRDFNKYLPQADVYIFDNNSRDDTAAIARAAGATVRSVPLQGKGEVIRRMFADVAEPMATFLRLSVLAFSAAGWLGMEVVRLTVLGLA